MGFSKKVIDFCSQTGTEIQIDFMLTHEDVLLCSGGVNLNKYQRILNKASEQALANHRMTIKLKYKDKWLPDGTPMNNPVHIAFEAEFSKPSYRQIRKTIKNNYRNLDDLNTYIRRTIEDNATKYYMLFNEDIKYNNK